MKSKAYTSLLFFYFVISGVLVGQSSTSYINQIKSKFASWDVVCGKISVHEEHPEFVRDYEKWVFADNRSGMTRIIYIPDLQRTYYFNGSETWIFFNQEQTFIHASDSMAVHLFLQRLDHISKLLLTRARPGINTPGNEGPNLMEEIISMTDKECRIAIRTEDVPEYFIRDNQLVLDFNLENMDLTHSRMTYIFLDDLIVDEYSLDTVYSNPTQVDSILSDIQIKLATFSLQEEQAIDNPKNVEVPFSEIYDQLKFVNSPPTNSDYYLFDFYYIQCPPCLKAVPAMKSLQETFPSDVLSIIAINPYDSHERISAFMDKTQITYSSAMVDKELLNNRGAAFAFPTFVLFNKQGDVLWQSDGYTPTLFEEIAEIIGRY